MPIKSLSPKQKKALQIIKNFLRATGKSPTLGELKRALGLKYVNSAVQLLNRLEEKGFIRRKPGQERGIKILFEQDEVVEIPLVGNVACGLPLLAEQNIEGYIPVDKGLVRGDPKNYFFLRAVGDSMDLVGINDGDLVLVKSQSIVDNGDKVVALVEDEATIKKFYRREDCVVLEPKSTNRNHKPIIMRSDFKIQGKVKMVIKEGGGR